MKFIDFFAGIGGFHSGLENAGHEMVGWVEWDKFARQSYEALYDTEGKYTASDIKSIESGKELPSADLWAFGSPCTNIRPAIEKDSKENNQACSLKLSDSLKTELGKRNLPISSWKMLKTYLVQTKDLTSSEFSMKWTKLGMMSNGKCLIPAGLSLKTANGYTSLDISAA